MERARGTCRRRDTPDQSLINVWLAEKVEAVGPRPALRG